MRKTSNQHGSAATLRAARAFSRRTLLKGAAMTSAVVGVVGGAGPWIVRNAFSSSGEVRLMLWAGYDFSEILNAFQSDTGITPVVTEFPDQDAMLAQMKASGGEGFDIAEPAADRVPNWVEQEMLQPIDESKVNLSGINQAFLGGAAGSAVVIGGQRYGLPTIWGTEAIAYNTDAAPLTYGEASYGDIWRPDFSGQVTVRGHSSLVGIGLWLEGQGKLPQPMRASFESEEVMVQNYDAILAAATKLREQVGQFWKDENSAQGAFRTNGCVIGQNWDTTAGALMREGLPIGYLAPKEGALAWMQSFVVPKGANAEQAGAWLSWFATPKASAMWAKAFSANPTAAGAEEHMPAESKQFLAAAYPGDALEKLWWWPVQASWFVSKRTEYEDRFMSA